MDANARVTVRLNQDGEIAGLDIEGDIDRTNLTEEVRPDAVPPLGDDRINNMRNPLAGIG